MGVRYQGEGGMREIDSRNVPAAPATSMPGGPRLLRLACSDPARGLPAAAYPGRPIGPGAHTSGSGESMCLSAPLAAAGSTQSRCATTSKLAEVAGDEMKSIVPAQQLLPETRPPQYAVPGRPGGSS